jgi:alanine racemase
MKKDFRTWVEINKSTPVSNIKQFRKIIGPEVKFCAVVKSNAYGHGLVEIARICENSGADWFGVDSIDEALILKKAGVFKLPILILGYVPLSQLAEAVKNGFKLTVYNKETVKELRKVKSQKSKLLISISK